MPPVNIFVVNMMLEFGIFDKKKVNIIKGRKLFAFSLKKVFGI